MLSFHDVVFAIGGFLDDKLNFTIVKNWAYFQRGLNHDSGQKFQISLKASFLYKRSGVVVW